MKCNQQSAEAEQGNCREKNAGAQIAAPTRIGHKAKVSHATHMANVQKGPEQECSSDQGTTMKERLEIVLCQKGKQTVSYKRLGRPKKNWSKQRCNDNDRDKIRRQFSYVFQSG